MLRFQIMNNPGNKTVRINFRDVKTREVVETHRIKSFDMHISVKKVPQISKGFVYEISHGLLHTTPS